MTVLMQTRLPLPTKSSRIPAYRSRASARGWVTACLPADRGRMRILVYESWLEQQVLWLLLLRCDLYDLWAQPQAIQYLNKEGRQRNYTFDFMLITNTSRRIAIAVRPKCRVSSRYQELLGLVFSQLPKDFADAAILISDEDFDRNIAFQAKVLLTEAKVASKLAEEDILSALAKMPSGASVGALTEITQLGRHALPAIIRLWQGQVIHTRSAGLVGPQTIFFMGET